jgi:hypothetical protein
VQWGDSHQVAKAVDWLVIQGLRRASEGVKQKLLCGHLLSSAYSNSPFVCPSTKVSPSSDSVVLRASELGSHYAGTTCHVLLWFMWSLSAGRPHDWTVIRTNSYLHIARCIFNIRSHGSSTTSTCSTNNLHEVFWRTRRTALIRSYIFHFDRAKFIYFHYYISSQLETYNSYKLKSSTTNSSK